MAILNILAQKMRCDGKQLFQRSYNFLTLDFQNYIHLLRIVFGFQRIALWMRNALLY